MKTRGKVALGALGLGLVWGTAIGAAVWVAVGTKYTAVSYLRVEMTEPALIRPSEPRKTDPVGFEIYQKLAENNCS